LLLAALLPLTSARGRLGPPGRWLLGRRRPLRRRRRGPLLASLLALAALLPLATARGRLGAR